MPIHPIQRLAPLAVVAALAGGTVAAGPALARHGADDPAAHEAGDDHGGARTTTTTGDRSDDRGGERRSGSHRGRGRHGRRHHRRHEAELRHGADDAAGHVRHSGDDDGPGHT